MDSGRIDLDCPNGTAEDSVTRNSFMAKCAELFNVAPAKILCGLIGLMGAPLQSLISARRIASFEFPRLAFLKLAAAANAMHYFALHDLPIAIYPDDSHWSIHSSA